MKDNHLKRKSNFRCPFINGTNGSVPNYVCVFYNDVLGFRLYVNCQLPIVLVGMSSDLPKGASGRLGIGDAGEGPNCPPVPASHNLSLLNKRPCLPA